MEFDDKIETVFIQELEPLQTSIVTENGMKFASKTRNLPTL